MTYAIFKTPNGYNVTSFTLERKQHFQKHKRIKLSYCSSGKDLSQIKIYSVIVKSLIEINDKYKAEEIVTFLDKNYSNKPIPTYQQLLTNHPELFI